MPNSSTPPFALGTFSIAGGVPFAGLVIDEKVIAARALNAHAGTAEERISGADNLRDILDDWDRNLPAIVNWAKRLKDGKAAPALTKQITPVTALHVHAPVEEPRQMLMARANYRRHILELLIKMGKGEGANEAERRANITAMIDRKATSGEPFLWVKTLTTVAGPYDEIELPPTTKQPDWELELAAVIGKPARNVSKEDALSYVAGYCIANDLSSRDRIHRDEMGPSNDWIEGKCSPGFMPMGPYLVPAQFIADPQDLHILLKHNGDVMQDERTKDMIHDTATIIAYASRHVQLMPGDIISTGSPAGNGMEFGIFLKPGDVVEGTITGLGTQRNTFRKFGA